MKPFNLKKYFVITVLALAVFLVADYLNIPTRLGIEVGLLNLDLQAIVINTASTIILFMATYYLIERWNVGKAKNQRDVAVQILKRTYEECCSWLDVLDKPGMIGNLVKKTDFNSTDSENTPAAKITKAAFENEHLILQFCADGVLPSSQVETYFNIKSSFSRHINSRILFFDAVKYTKPTLDELLEQIETARRELEK